jgi:hypothetical protein
MCHGRKTRHSIFLKIPLIKVEMKAKVEEISLGRGAFKGVVLADSRNQKNGNGASCSGLMRREAAYPGDFCS